MLCSTAAGLHPKSLSTSRAQSSSDAPPPLLFFHKLSRRYVADETETYESSDSCGCNGSGSDSASFDGFALSLHCEVTGVMGLVGEDGRETSAFIGLDDNSLDAGARGSVIDRPARTSPSAFAPIARLSEEESIDVFNSGGLLELRCGNNEGAEIIDGEIEPGVLGEAGEDREGESRASK